MGLLTSLAFNIDWDGKFVQGMGEVIIESAFRKPALSQFNTVANGIVAKTRVGTMGRLNKFTRIDAGCGTGQTDKAIPSSQKIWDPQKLKIWLTQCEDDIDETFFVWATRSGIDRKDLTGTDFVDFLMDILPDGAMEDLMRIAYLGDDSLVAGDLSGGAADLPNYTPVNGFWKKGLAELDVNITDAIPENDAVDKATQIALANDRALSVYETLLDNADSRLVADPSAVIVSTRSLTRNYAKTLRSKNVDSSFTRIEGGYNSLAFDGVPVIEFELLDRYIRADLDDGTVYDTPHRAFLTTPSNLLIGSDNISRFDDFDVFFDKIEEKLHIKGGYKLDVQISENHMTAFAS